VKARPLAVPPFVKVAEVRCTPADGDAFYPERITAATDRAVLAVCGPCPLRRDCLDYSLEHGETLGYWGGLNVRERRRIANRRALTGAAA
jgi:WhiB family transcriptional regulator, redox-sensing transcriptional regulator